SGGLPVGEFDFDGGVIEVSTDDGATWGPLDGKLSGKDFNGTVYDGSNNVFGSTTNPLSGRKAFVGSSDNFPTPVSTTIDLSSYATMNIKLRFRLGTDSGGAVAGWLVSGIALSGANMPFPSKAMQGGSCHAPVANAGADQAVNEGLQVTL